MRVGETKWNELVHSDKWQMNLEKMTLPCDSVREKGQRQLVVMNHTPLHSYLCEPVNPANI